MASWIRFLIFIAIIAIVVFVFAANFVVLVGFGVALLLGVAILAAANDDFGGWVGEALNATGRNNNLRLYALVALTVITLIGAMKYGAGEPIFTTAAREIADEFVQHYDGTTANAIVYGKAVSNQSLESRRAIAETRGSATIPPQVRQKGEEASDYNRKIANYLSQGVFGDDKKADNLVFASVNNLASTPSIQESFLTVWMRDSGRTWFLWQLSFVFLAMSILYAPFAFRDEVMDFVDRKLGQFEAMKDTDGKTKDTPPPPPTPSGTGEATAASGITGIAKIIAVDAAMEVIYKLIKRMLGGNR